MDSLSSTQPSTMLLTSSLGHLAEFVPEDSGELMTPTFFGSNIMTNTTYQYPDFSVCPKVVENNPIIRTKKIVVHQHECEAVLGGVLNRSSGEANGLKEVMDQFLSPPSQEVDTSDYPNLVIVEDLFNEDLDGNVSYQQGFESKYKEFISMPMVGEVTTTNPIKFVALKCSKKKNPNYLIEDEKEIITKDKIAVNFWAEGAKQGDTAWATLRYVDPILVDKPVEACPSHSREWSNGEPHSKEFTLYSSQCLYKMEEGHPTVCIPIPFDDKGHMLKFYLAFICLNSCHKSKGKLIDLLMILKDAKGKVKKRQIFNLRVCRNVKRDHKEMKRSAEEPPEEEVEAKVAKLDPEAMVAADPLPCVAASVPLPSPSPQAVQDETKLFYLVEGLPSTIEKFLPLFGSMDLKIHPIAM